MGNNGSNKSAVSVAAIAGLAVIFVVLLVVFIVLLTNLNTPEAVPPKPVGPAEGTTVTDVGTNTGEGQAPQPPATPVNQGNQPQTPETAEVIDPVTMYVANVKNSVYFRSEPKEVDSNIMETIAVGTKVLFLKNEGNTFAKIEYNGKTGYVKRDYLSHSKPEPQTTTTVVDNSIKYYKYVVDVPNSVYLRKGPSSNSGHYTTIPLGEMVGFIEFANNTYSKVSYNGQIGYVTSKYLGDYYSAPSDSYMTVYNVKAAIYLRSEPVEKSGNIICEIPVGSKVKYLDSGNGTFYRISWNGKTGYSKSEYLTW